jgi:hypothetical protein
MTFSFREYGTFSGPGAQYKFRESDDFTNIFEDPTFNLDDVSMVLLSTPSDYVYLHLDGTSTANVSLERSTGPITQFFVDATTSYFNGNVTIDQNLNILGTLNVIGAITGTTITRLDAQHQVAISLPAKPFDIPHPSKPETHRLRYISLEGPEIAVYFRGKLENTNVIELPEYWKDLIHSESISVNLTPYGDYQELYVEKIILGQQIIVRNRESELTNCYFTVYAERKDMEKLIVEYEGSSLKDYPGQDWLNLR